MTLRTGWTDRAYFVDTSAFYAFLDPDDQWHARALEGFGNLGRRRTVLTTSNLVVAETYRLTSQRLGPMEARAWLDMLDDVNIRFQTEDEHLRTMGLLPAGTGTRLSYTDAASLVAMELAGIRSVFSFDRDFEYRGFTRFPELDG